MRALIYGNGISGKGANKLLTSLGYDVQYIDDETDIEVLDNCDMLVLSPAIAMDKPLVVTAISRGIEVIGELELGYRLTRGDIIAITGTNGKTTTAMMLDAVLRETDIRHHLLGNIGRSLSQNIDKIGANDVVVLETSSFQLESIAEFRPHIGVLLNLGVDHLERHGGVKEYHETKLRLFENMEKTDIAVLNADDTIIAGYSESLNVDVRYFSTKRKTNGAYLQDRVVWYADERICLVKDLHLFGEHNISNALAVITVAKLLGIPNHLIMRGIRTFSLPPHRIQFIGRYRHKNYYNDSKATNIEATMSALKCMKGTVTLIIGGYDKGISYMPLLTSLDKSVRSIILFGQNRHAIEKELSGLDIRYYVESSLLRAIERASRERVDNVLFSPGTSSFDMFKNYEERGDMFIKLVGDINED